MHIASKYTLKKALRLADEYKKTTLKSYILEELEESNTVKQNFYIWKFSRRILVTLVVS